MNSENDIAGALARQLFRRGSFAPRVAVESENMGTMLRLCLLGRGAYFCPENLARALLSEEDWKSFMSCILRKGSMSFPSAGRPEPTAGR